MADDIEWANESTRRAPLINQSLIPLIYRVGRAKRAIKQTQRKIITRDVLIARVCGLALGSSRVAAGAAAGWISALISWILIAEGDGAGAAGGREHRRHRGRLGRQIVVVLVARQHRHASVVVTRLGQPAVFRLGEDHVAVSGIFAVRIDAAKLEVRLTLWRRQIEEARPGRCIVRRWFRLVVERRRIDYVGRRCVRLGIGDLRPDGALVRV